VEAELYHDVPHVSKGLVFCEAEKSKQRGERCVIYEVAIG